MTSISSRSLTQHSTSTLDHQWDPYQVLDLEHDNRCVGWAHTKDRKCLQPVNHRDKSIFHDILSEISSQPLDADELQPELRELARHGLCLQARHRENQVNSMVEKWTISISTVARIAQEQARWQRPLLRSGSTTESFATSSFSTPTRRTTRSSSPAMPAPMLAQTEVDCLRLSIAAMQATIEETLRRIEHMESPHAPRIEPIRPLDRVSTTDISSMYLPTPTTSLTASPARINSSTPSTRSSSPARSTSSRRSTASVPSSTSSTASSAPTERHQHTQHTTTPPTPSSRRPHTPNPSSPSLPTQQAQPSIPTTPPCTLPHVRRLPLDSTSSCPICYEPMTASSPSSSYSSSSSADTDTEWCKAGCGQSVHTVCMDAWRASCAQMDMAVAVRCTMCRTRWEGDCAC